MHIEITFFLTILLLFLYLTQLDLIIEYSDTILGKLIIVFIIILYTLSDKLIGLFMCVLIILFLQSHFIENMLNINEYVENFDTLQPASFSPFQNDFILPSSKGNTLEKENIHHLYKGKSVLNKTTKYNEDFKKNNCNELKLKYKNMDVPDDMIRHVFPELKFHDETCNICHNNCKFSVLEEKMKTQKELQPKDSNEE
tara:strand:+ start:3177 stop:3770 length:594 start_codon:yes stop_codon:yes gene_type:complete